MKIGIKNKIEKLRDIVYKHETKESSGKNNREEDARNRIVNQEKKMLEGKSARYRFQDLSLGDDRYLVEMVEMSYTTPRNSVFSAAGDSTKDVYFMQMRVFDLNGKETMNELDNVVMGTLVKREKNSGTEDFGKVEASCGIKIGGQWQEVKTNCETGGWEAFKKVASAIKKEKPNSSGMIDAFLLNNPCAERFFKGLNVPVPQRSMNP